MKCSRCDAELAPSASFCPECGSTSQQEKAGYFSYLPAGTPPWPATLPTTTTAPVTTQPAESVGTKLATKPSRSLRSILIAATLLLLTPIVGGLLTLGTLYARGDFPFERTPPSQVDLAKQPAPTATKTSDSTTSGQAQNNQLPTPTSFKTTSNKDLNISLQYPSDWIAEAPQKSNSATTVGVHPQQQLGIAFVVRRFSDSVSSSIGSPEEINQGVITSLSDQGAHNLQNIPSSSAHLTIGGTQWTQQEASFTNDTGDKFHFTTISAQHNKGYYNIVAYAPDIYQAEAMEKYIRPILQSIHFLS